MYQAHYLLSVFLFSQLSPYFLCFSAPLPTQQNPPDTANRQVRFYEPDPTAGLPLEVLRVTPQGPVERARILHITFSKPMVPLTRTESGPDLEVPVKLKPQPPGQWRWLTPLTLIFEAENRFPGSQMYTVEIPAGCTAMDGSAMTQSRSFSFQTPPAAYTKSFYEPEQTAIGAEGILLNFNQKVLAQDLQPHITFLVNEQPTPFLLRNIETQHTVQYESQDPSQSVRLKAEHPLPPNSKVVVILNEGLPSAEGPLLSTQGKTLIYKSEPSFQVLEVADCKVHFSKHFNGEMLKPEWLSVEPEPEDFFWEPHGQTFNMKGEFEIGQTYTVTLSPEITDNAGNHLDGERVFQMRKSLPNTPFQGPIIDMMYLHAQKNQKLELLKATKRAVQYQFYKVELEDFERFQTTEPGPTGEYPGTLLLADQISPSKSLQARDFQIDLKPFLNEGFGHFIWTGAYLPKETRGESDTSQETFKPTPHHAWIQVTHSAIHTFWDCDHLYVLVTRIDHGSPREDVSVSIHQGRLGNRVTAVRQTDENGIAVFPLPKGRNASMWVVAKKGPDTSFHELKPNMPGEMVRDPKQISRAGHMLTDRGTYQPGDTVMVKGWIRERVLGGKIHAAAFLPYRFQINHHQKTLLEGTGTTDEFGAFHQTIPLPANCPTQTLYLRIVPMANSGRTLAAIPIKVAQFQLKRASLEWAATPPESCVKGENIQIAARHRDFNGTPIQGAEILLNTSPRDTGYFSIPGPDHYTFTNRFLQSAESLANSSKKVVMTDGEGLAKATPNLSNIYESIESVSSLDIEATIRDFDQQSSTILHKTTIFPGKIAVGISAGAFQVQVDRPTKLQFITCDLKGNRVRNQPIKVRIWKMVNRKDDPILLHETKLTTKDGTTSITYVPPYFGQYLVEAETKDGEGRTWRTVHQFNAHSSLRYIPAGLSLRGDKQIYNQNETIQLEAECGDGSGPATLVVYHAKGLELKPIQFTDGKWTGSVHIKEDDAPSLEIGILSHPRIDDSGIQVPARVALRTVQIRNPDQELEIRLSPNQPIYHPGDNVTLNIEASKQGQDLQAVVWVVDEAALAKDDTTWENPRENALPDHDFRSNFTTMADLIFWKPRPVHLSDTLFHKTAFPERPLPSDPSRQIVYGFVSTKEDLFRSHFSSLAAFFPEVVLDYQGKAELQFQLPDSLTRYRIMAVVADKNEAFGIGETYVDTRKELMLRVGPPCNLFVGDQIEVPVLIQNRGGEDTVVRLDLETDQIRLLGPRAKKVAVSSGAEETAGTHLLAEQAGTAQLRVSANSDSGSDALQVSLPVLEGSTPRTTAVQTILHQDTLTIPLQLPENSLPDQGGLSIQLESDLFKHQQTLLQNMCSNDLFSMPARAKRALSLTFAAQAFPTLAPLFKPTLDSDLNELRQGFENSPIQISALIAQLETSAWGRSHMFRALLIHPDFLSPQERAAALSTFEKDLTETYKAGARSEETNADFQTHIAYGIYILTENGRDVSGFAQTMWRKKGTHLPLAAQAFLASSYPEITPAWFLETLENTAMESATSANFRTFIAYENGANLYNQMVSPNDLDAIILEALLSIAPDHELVAKTFADLNQIDERSLYAEPDPVFTWAAIRKLREVSPKFTRAAVLVELRVAEETLYQNTLDPDGNENAFVEIPMKDLVNRIAGEEEISLHMSGEGSLNCRINLSWLPAERFPEPATRGFHLFRSYQRYQQETNRFVDVEKTGDLKLGDQVLVTLYVNTNKIHNGVILEDFLPAGLEFSHQRLGPFSLVSAKDGRILFEGSPLSQGYRVQYYATVRHAGNFYAPAALIRAKFEPETHGTSATSRITVNARKP